MYNTFPNSEVIKERRKLIRMQYLFSVFAGVYYFTKIYTLATDMLEVAIKMYFLLLNLCNHGGCSLILVYTL